MERERDDFNLLEGKVEDLRSGFRIANALVVAEIARAARTD